MRKLIFLFACLFWVGIGLTQSNSISGRVLSAETREPIIGATVVVQEIGTGTITDINGNFFIAVPNASATLVFSYLGYRQVEMLASDGMTVRMQTDAQTLDEVIITGYGVIQRGAFTGSAQVVTSADLTRQVNTNVLTALEGTVAGLQLNTFTGNPGAFAATNIRGVGSANSGTEPLFVIDGVPMFTDRVGHNSAAGDGEMAASVLANLNPNDIESITVLRDATATSIYGARAANGVIVITTKRGAAGQTRFNLNSRFGSSFVHNLDHNYRMVGLERYKNIWQEGLVNAGFATEESSAEVLNSFIDSWFGVDLSQDIKSVDWLQEILRVGHIQEHDLSVSGGNENLRFFMSGGFLQNEGIMIGTGMTRYSGRVNLDGRSGRISFGVNASGAFSSIDNALTESQFANPLVAVYDLRPFEQVRNEDGTFNLGAEWNPVALVDAENGDVRNQRQTTAVVNPYFTVDILDKELVWKTNAGLHLLDLNESQFWGRYNPQANQSGLYGMRNTVRATTLTITNTLNWNKTFGDHSINVLGGQEAQRIQRETMFFSAVGFPDGVRELAAASTPTGASSDIIASTMVSFLSRAEYGFQHRYYVSGSFRYDASSRFGANNRWSPFWSLGARWRISSESFMENTNHWLNDLTLRGSYGTVGNQDIGFFAAQGLFNYGYRYNGLPGARLDQYPNPDLRWERGAKANIGFNARLFNRISVEVDLYDERTKDMIFAVPLSRPTGLTSILQNVGEMQNKGIEFLISANVLRYNDFSWDVRVTGASNKNTILRLATDYPIAGTITIRQVGEAFHTFYMPKWAGVDPETGAPQWYKGTEGNELTTNIREAGQRIVGSADPKFFGGFGMSFSYKGFDLAFDANYMLGNLVYNTGFSFDMQVGDYVFGPVSNYVYENAWRNPGDRTNVPRFVADDNSGANTHSSRFLMDGSFLRMRNITLGYTLPRQLVNRVQIDNLRVYASADNLFTITASDYIGFDPQTRPNGFQSWAYPLPTNIVFGINVGF